jgi:ribosomal protein L11 methyltransferase
MLRPPYKEYTQFYIYGFRKAHPELRDFDDPDLIGYWEEDGIGVLFFHKPKDVLVDSLVKKYNLILDVKDVVPFSEWNERRIPRPFKVGPIRIAPIWYEGEYDLRFDPSVVFGEGRHPTTEMVLNASWDLYNLDPTIEKVFDLGCGSGILTLLWAKLGKKVVALDYNPLCVRVAKHNLALNNLSAEVIEGDVREHLPYEGDLILANLYKGLLLELLSKKEFFSARYYILSGIVYTMCEEIESALAKAPVKILEKREKDNWVCYLLAHA